MASPRATEAAGSGPGQCVASAVSGGAVAVGRRVREAPFARCRAGRARRGRGGRRRGWPWVRVGHAAIVAVAGARRPWRHERHGERSWSTLDSSHREPPQPRPAAARPDRRVAGRRRAHPDEPGPPVGARAAGRDGRRPDDRAALRRDRSPPAPAGRRAPGRARRPVDRDQPSRTSPASTPSGPRRCIAAAAPRWTTSSPCAKASARRFPSVLAPSELPTGRGGAGRRDQGLSLASSHRRRRTPQERLPPVPLQGRLSG